MQINWNDNEWHASDRSRHAGNGPKRSVDERVGAIQFRIVIVWFGVVYNRWHTDQLQLALSGLYIQQM
jgi:hypothetical protein